MGDFAFCSEYSVALTVMYQVSALSGCHFSTRIHRGGRAVGIRFFSRLSGNIDGKVATAGLFKSHRWVSHCKPCFSVLGFAFVGRDVLFSLAQFFPSRDVPMVCVDIIA